MHLHDERPTAVPLYGRPSIKERRKNGKTLKLSRSVKKCTPEKNIPRTPLVCTINTPSIFTIA